jgi:mRNA-degrading endonuclease RelE of RelBE toxin-antitoxin system
MVTPAFSVRVTPQCERLIKGLNKAHPDFIAQYEKAISILSSDPYNRARSHQIKKLQNVAPGEGAWRLRLGRWRFRYDTWDQQVELSYCGLRREDTYE